MLQSSFSNSSPEEKQVENLVDPICKALGLELVGVRYLKGKDKGIVKVIIDKVLKEEGNNYNESSDLTPVGSDVTIEDCTQVSRDLSAVFDQHEGFLGGASFQLEVTSPGLDRPLFKFSDFARFKGHQAKIQTVEKVGESRNFSGKLVGIKNETDVVLEVKQQEVQIPYFLISNANLVF